MTEPKTRVIISNYDGGCKLSVMIDDRIYEDEDLPEPLNILVAKLKPSLYLRKCFNEEAREIIAECYPEDFYDVILCEDGYIEKII